MRISMTAAGLLLAAALSVPASANVREPTKDEKEAIESTLKTAGFASWEHIMLDDDKWQVDNAKADDGKTYDLELGLASYEIMSKKEDD